MTKKLYKRATMQDLDRIVVLYDDCKKRLLEKRVYQWGKWDSDYPGIKHLRQSIMEKELFLLTFEGSLIGSVVLNEIQNSQMDSLPWTKDKNNALHIHAFAIAPKEQGRGYGKKLLECCEKYARASGYNVMRLNAYRGNTISNLFYKNAGYNPVGSVIFGQKPDASKEYCCYEKIL